MSKSYDYIKENISRSQYTQEGNIKEIINTEEIFDANRLHGSRVFQAFTPSGGELDIELTFAPDADFEYFTSSSNVHDGTIYFVYECMEMVLHKLLYVQTYLKTKPAPKSNSTISYTVGNIVLINQENKNPPEDKPYLVQKTIVLLPLKYSIREGLINFDE